MCEAESSAYTATKTTYHIDWIQKKVWEDNYFLLKPIIKQAYQKGKQYYFSH